jgi:hypothetical protein
MQLAQYQQLFAPAGGKALPQENPWSLYEGRDPIAAEKWARGAKAHTVQLYRTGTVGAVRVEPVLAGLGTMLGGALQQWHVRSRAMFITLHQHVLQDWVCAGQRIQDRAERARAALRSVAAADLLDAPLLSMLTRARHAYYLANPSRVPVVKVRLEVRRPDNTMYLETTDQLRAPAEQSRLDNLKEESDSSLHHAFLLPPGAASELYYAEFFEAPVQSFAQEVIVDQVEEGEEGDSYGAGRASSPPLSEIQPQRPGAEVDATVRDVFTQFATDASASLRASAGRPTGRRLVDDLDAAADSSARIHRPAASTRTRNTTTTSRQIVRTVHPDWHVLSAELRRAGSRMAVHSTLQLHHDQEENLPILQRFEAEYLSLLERNEVPQIEDVYLLLFKHHTVNKPSPQQAAVLTHLIPDPTDAGTRKNPLEALHKWDVKYHLHVAALLHWLPDTRTEILYQIYTNGLRSSSATGWRDAAQHLTAFRPHDQLEAKVVAARQAVMRAVQAQQEEAEFSRHLAHHNARDPERPPAAPKAEKPPAAPREQRRNPAAGAYYTQGQYDGPQGGPPLPDAYAWPEGTPAPWQYPPYPYPPPGQYYSAPAGGPPAHDGQAYNATAQRPAALLPPPARAPAQKGTRAATAEYHAVPPPARAAGACPICHLPHKSPCFVQHPGRAYKDWRGPPHGNLSVYKLYVANARADPTLSEADIRDYVDAAGDRHKAASVVPIPAGAWRSTANGESRTPHPKRRDQVDANLALRIAVQADDEQDPAADSIYGYRGGALTARRADKPRVALATTRAEQRRLDAAADAAASAAMRAAPAGAKPPASKQPQAASAQAAPTRKKAPRAKKGGARAAAAAAPPPTPTRQPPRGPSAAGRRPPPLPYTPDAIDPTTPPAQLPNAQRVNRPGYSSAGELLLPAALAPPAFSPALAKAPARGQLPRAQPSNAELSMSARFPTVTPEGPTATLQYMLRQGPMMAEGALSACGGVVISVGDVLFKVPLTQCYIELPDATSLPALHPAAMRPMPPAASAPAEQLHSPAALPSAAAAPAQHLPATSAAAEHPPAAAAPARHLPATAAHAQHLPAAAAPARHLPAAAAHAQHLPATSAVAEHLPAAAAAPAQHPPATSAVAEHLPAAAAAPAQHLPATSAAVDHLPATAAPAEHLPVTPVAAEQLPSAAVFLADTAAEQMPTTKTPELTTLPLVVSVQADDSAATQQLAHVGPADSVPAPAAAPEPAAVADSSHPEAAADSSNSAAAADSSNSEAAAEPAEWEELAATEHATWDELPSALAGEQRTYIPPQHLSGNPAFRAKPAARAAVDPVTAALHVRRALADCPCPTPILFVPNLPHSDYLSINELGTNKPANKWEVAVFDSGADVTLVSKEFAVANNLAFGGNSLAINTADGGHTETLGELHHPLEFWLARGTPNACRAVAAVQVMEGAGRLYDVIISTELILQWSAYVDPMDSTLYYRPRYWTRGIAEHVAILPMLITEKAAPPV